jgi:hypothetical protein
MPTAYKVLGQSAPAANTLTTIYTVPASTSAVCSTLAIANRGVSTFFRVAIRPAGAAIANSHYIAYDTVVSQYDSIFLTLGISLAATDVVSVFAATADVSFSLFGAEIS